MKTLKSILIIGIIFFAGQALLIFGLNSIMSMSNFRFARLYYSHMDYEVVTIGNSRGVNSIYTPYIKEKYGYNAVNMSFNGLSMDLVDAILRDYVDRNPNPKLILIELTSLFYSDKEEAEDNEDPYEFNIFYTRSDRLKHVLDQLDPKLKYINFFFGLYRYNSKYFYRSLYYIPKKTDADWINRNVITEVLINLSQDMDNFTSYVADDKLELYRKLVADLEAKGIKVVVYIAPYYPNHLQHFKNFRQLVAKAQLPGQYILDYSLLLNDNKYFADRVHTNITGAKRICDEIFQREDVQHALER